MSVQGAETQVAPAASLQLISPMSLGRHSCYRVGNTRRDYDASYSVPAMSCPAPASFHRNGYWGQIGWDLYPELSAPKLKHRALLITYRCSHPVRSTRL